MKKQVKTLAQQIIEKNATWYNPNLYPNGGPDLTAKDFSEFDFKRLKNLSDRQLWEAGENAGRAADNAATAARKVKMFSPMGAAQTLGIIGASMLINQFIAKMMDKFKEHKIEKAEPGYFKAMIEKNPQLIKENPEEVADLWATLYKQAPGLAADPIAAGAFITQNVHAKVRRDLGGPPIDTYKTLAEITDKQNGEGSDPRFTELFANSAMLFA